MWHFFSHRLYLSDEAVVKKQFKKSQGYELDLKNPKTFNEKTQWLKLYDRTDRHTLFADKYAVREFMARKYGDDALVPLIIETKNWHEITFESLPNEPFIIKPNHGSGWYHIIYDKNTIDIKKLQTDCRYWLSQNYYSIQREWQYKNIVPRILVEKLLIPKNGSMANNYRFHCFSGKVEVISVNVCFDDPNNFVAKKYNKNWEFLKFSYGIEVINEEHEKIEISRPINFDRMIFIAEDLAKMFAYIRVDFFEVDGTLYYGELTFHDSSGYDKINPFEWDEKLGAMIDLK
jgi:hypothetical protein